MLKNDRWIRQMGERMITPFTPEQVRSHPDTTPCLSYGTGSYSYDIRLSPKDFRIFRHVPGGVVNPKAFDSQYLERAQLHSDKYGAFFIIPSNSYGLGVAVERLEIPNDITAVCLGKSSYARCGAIVNATPAEAGWQGHLTLEISNSSNADIRVYANEGICALLFFEGEPCATTYQRRKSGGKYQGQKEEIVFVRV